ncbi:MAG: sulfite exporter TauE/SafE family protein [Planctomycetes bacterium]|nr:sulfite exporter TauE/SafE family protein [Planctomycetota bacterium]
MLDPKAALLVCLGVVGAAFLLFWARALLASRRAPPASAASAPAATVSPSWWHLLVGFITDFFDTLGIGSFATTTSLYRARRTIDDRLLPGTLNVGHTLPTIAQAYIYIEVVKVEIATLVWMIAAAIAGSLLGAPIVARWPRRPIQIGIGLALLVLCGVLVFRQLGDAESSEWPVLRDLAAFVRDHIGSTQGGTAIGLSGGDLAIGVVGNFVLGALMTIGVGLYAPCLVMVAMLGMNPDTGFPIMMGSCAFLMPMASVSFIRHGSYSPRAALGLTIAGVPAVLIAAYVVKSLPLYWMKWLIALVVIYTSVMLLRAAAAEKNKSKVAAA